MNDLGKDRGPIDICVPVELLEALNWPKPPDTIWQAPFDYERGHCERIAQTSKAINTYDFCDYFLDYQYMEVQKDLFLYVLPKALEAWARGELKMPRKEYFKGEWHFEGMWEAFDARPVDPEFLTDQQYEAMLLFLARILDNLMMKERHLVFEGQGASPYAWIGLHATLVFLFPVAEKIWKKWWRFETLEHALCGMQWLSTLMYEDGDNPLFSPWTASNGGGPPLIFEPNFLPNAPADAQNIAFLKETLSNDWALDCIKRANLALKGSHHVAQTQNMIDDFPRQAELVQTRTKKFISVLEATDSWEKMSW